MEYVSAKESGDTTVTSRLCNAKGQASCFLLFASLDKEDRSFLNEHSYHILTGKFLEVQMYNITAAGCSLYE